MTQMLEPMLSEFRTEAATTRRVLERVPADKLSWRPHPKSMSLGQLALHVASIPGSLARLLSSRSLTPLRPISSRQFRTMWNRFMPPSTRVFDPLRSA